MQTGYTKLFSTIVTSTIWSESKETKILWVTMLALMDRRSIVESSVPGLAKLAGLTIEEIESSLKVLESTDQYSRTTLYEGRRIEKIEGGWKILNGDYYRKKMSAEDRREYFRSKQAEYRAAKRLGSSDEPSSAQYKAKESGQVKKWQDGDDSALD